MDLDTYQEEAAKTRKPEASAGASLTVPILGLAGETGELVNEYKKYLRDGAAHVRFADRVREELGDILWYVAATATEVGISLNDIAEYNLEKTNARWRQHLTAGEPSARSAAFDDPYPNHERFPRKFIAEFEQRVEEGQAHTYVFVEGRQMGQPLTDNAHAPDGYRFHDVFHLACVAVLGWSPVTRRNLGLKRRSRPEIDEIEDGGRAIVTEEGISALVFAYAADHNRLEGLEAVDYDLLKAIRVMTVKLEVSVCTTGEWERAIIDGYRVWKKIEAAGGGKVLVNLDAREIEVVG
jgi:NTP pyrophosphatase (non-canonical NTP hydrolase)